MNGSSLHQDVAEEFARADLEEASEGVVRVEAGRILWSGAAGTGRTVEWDLGLATYMAASFAQHPETRPYVAPLKAAIAEAEAYHNGAL